MTLKEQAELMARNIFKKYNLSCPVNLYYLSDKLNATIEEIEMSKKVLGVRQKFKEGIYNGRYLIIVNKLQNLGRKRFTIAHEIGHIILNHNLPNSFLDSMIGCNKKYLLQYERQANVFAAELLMPKDIFKDMYFNRGIKDINKLTKTFSVSKQAIEIRIEEITGPPELLLPSYNQLSLF
jgi:Zn-dependent peptidase ImmA (M78 family)